MLGHRLLQLILRPSLAKVMGLAIFVCAVGLTEYRHPLASPSPSRKKASVIAKKNAPNRVHSAARKSRPKRPSSPIAKRPRLKLKADLSKRTNKPPRVNNAIARKHVPKTPIQVAQKAPTQIEPEPLSKNFLVTQPSKKPKRVAKKMPITKKPPPPRARPKHTAAKKIDLESELLSNESSMVLDRPTPLTELAELAFNEEPLAESFDLDPRVSAVQLPLSFYVEWRHPEVPKYDELIADYRSSSHTDLFQSLANVQEKTQLAEAIEAPPEESATTLVDLSEAEVETAGLPKRSLRKMSPVAYQFATILTTDRLRIERVRQTAQELAQSAETTQIAAAPTKPPAKPPTASPSPALTRPESKLDASLIDKYEPEPTRVAKHQPKELPTQVDSQVAEPVAETSDLQAAEPMNSQVNQGITSNLLVPGSPPQKKKKQTKPPAKKIAKAPTPEKKAPSPKAKRSEGLKVVTPVNEYHANGPRQSGTVYGLLSWDKAMGEWLKKWQGHVALKLFRKGKRPNRDSYPIEYRYPEDEFSFDARNLEGKYQLVARVFRKGRMAPVAVIRHSEVFEPAHYKKRIRFHLSESEFKRSQVSKDSTPGSSSVYLTIHEGALGYYGEPNHVAGAQVEVVGFPHWKSQVSDHLGDVHIPRVPNRSEIIVRISAKGFYPTYRTIPVRQSDVYQELYLVPTGLVKLVTELFTKNPQDIEGDNAVILGRIFSPHTTKPAKGERISLSHRSGQPVYFNEFPDLSLTETSEQGLFGFFNVNPFFRSLRREDRPAQLLNIRPGAGYFVEFGRGGAHTFHAELVDPFEESLSGLGVRIVGETHKWHQSDSKNQVYIDGVDLDPGLMTLEVEGEGYHKTWHTVSWGPHEKRKYYLGMYGQKLLDTARKRANVSSVPDTGTLIGIAGDKYLKSQKPCRFIELLNSKGEKLSADHGPFSLIEADSLNSPLCLTKTSPGFVFYNLPNGEYILNWLDHKGNVFRTNVHRVGNNRDSIALLR